jgi:UDP-N-acetylglucosamine 2-epimerase (non-hydrolysing)
MITDHKDVAPKTVMVCIGTRPEAIKLAPVIGALERHGMTPYVVSTAQHREMLDQMFASFDLEPDVDLGLMRPRQSLATLTASAIEGLADVLEEVRPDALIVQGDTTTAMSAALAGFYAGVPVAHVEAGLRTNDQRSPFPEEINRRLVSEIATWHFCPTETSAQNLVREYISPKCIEVTGNTVIDALHATIERQRREGFSPAGLPRKRTMRRILVTLHRRETQGEIQRELCKELAGICATHPEVEIVFPVHLSPAVRASVLTELGDVDRVHLIDPVGYDEFVSLLASSDLVVTDSGGVQEEAPSLDVPVLVMRDNTERPEGVAAGCARLCGTTPEALRVHVEQLLASHDDYVAMSSAPSPYGDGKASDRIAKRMAKDLGVRRLFTRPVRRAARAA